MPARAGPPSSASYLRSSSSAAPGSTARASRDECRLQLVPCTLSASRRTVPRSCGWSAPSCRVGTQTSASDSWSPSPFAAEGLPVRRVLQGLPEGDQCSRRHSRTTTPSRLAPSRVSANERLLLSAPVTQQKRAALGGRSRVAQREACMKDILRHRWPTTRARTTLVRCTHNFAVAAGVRLCGLAWSCRAAHAKP